MNRSLCINQGKTMAMAVAMAAAILTLSMALLLVTTHQSVLASGFPAPDATTYYVSPSGSNGNDCLSISTPCQTIAGALSKAVNGDTINVSTGTYTEHLTIATSVTIAGAGYQQTILDGGGIGRVLVVNAGVSLAVSGVTIRNGAAAFNSGGGIWYEDFDALQNAFATCVGDARYNPLADVDDDG